MDYELTQQRPLLIAGEGKLAYSIAGCLLTAGHPVTLLTVSGQEARQAVLSYCPGDGKYAAAAFDKALTILHEWRGSFSQQLAILVTDEDLQAKQQLILTIQQLLPADAVIAINTESIPLETLQEIATSPENIIGLNWVIPAHTTLFLEIIRNGRTADHSVGGVLELARQCWAKDPYVVQQGFSIRARMFAAMAREAFYLVEHDYASIENIDRASRNDAGYYSPFAGNFRYMDLMGPYAYGLVMKNLNRELSGQRRIPEFFRKLLSEGANGMENSHGFYDYQEGEPEQWEAAFLTFSEEIRKLIIKYQNPHHEKMDH